MTAGMEEGAARVDPRFAKGFAGQAARPPETVLNSLEGETPASRGVGNPAMARVDARPSMRIHVNHLFRVLFLCCCFHPYPVVVLLWNVL